VRVEGHADDRGTPQYNREISARRAAAVAQYLRAQPGLDRVQFEAVGHGNEHRVCTEDTEDCHAQNRNALLVIVP
jgi:peptidoglycan-associated lipoprotein